MRRARVVARARLARAAVALGTVLEAHGAGVDVAPEVRHRRDALLAAAAVRTLLTRDVLVVIGASERPHRLAAVDQQRVVRERAVNEAKVQVARVEAVLVPRARLAAVRQLVELVAASQAVGLYTVR